MRDLTAKDPNILEDIPSKTKTKRQKELNPKLLQNKLKDHGYETCGHWTCTHPM